MDHLPISVAFGVLLPSFMLSGRSEFFNTFKKGIYKIVMLQVFFLFCLCPSLKLS